MKHIVGAIGILLAFLSPAYAEDMPTIDVLVLYTPIAAQELLERGRSIEDEIAYVELMQNRIFKNSGVNATVRVFLQEWAEFDETKHIDARWRCDPPTADCVATNMQEMIIKDIEKATADNDAFSIKKHRDAVGADLVSLWVWQGGWDVKGSAAALLTDSGIANGAQVTGETTYMSLVLTEKAWLYWHFAHEIGHNFGLEHGDGYVDADAGFRTIMASDDNCQFSTCIRIPAYSNKDPGIVFFGSPIGNANHDSASILNKNAAFVASYRAPK